MASEISSISKPENQIAEIQKMKISTKVNEQIIEDSGLEKYLVSQMTNEIIAKNNIGETKEQIINSLVSNGFDVDVVEKAYDLLQGTPKVVPIEAPKEKYDNTRNITQTYTIFFNDVKSNQPKKHVIIHGQAGCGKTYTLKQMALNSGGNNLIIVPQHLLADEYVDALDCLKLMGFCRGCSIARNKKAGFKELKLLRDAGVAGYVKCMEMVSAKNCDGESCLYKPIWSALRDKEGTIQTSVVIPAAMQGVVDIREFDGMIIIDENCEDSAPRNFNFSLKTIINQLGKVAEAQMISKKLYVDYIKAIKQLNILYLIEFEEEMEESLRNYNEYVLMRYKSIKKRAKEYININFRDIRMICEFTHHQKKFNDKDIKYKFESKIEYTLSIITQLKQQMKHYQKMCDADDEDYIEAMEINQNQIQNTMKELFNFMRENDIDMVGVGLNEHLEFDYDDAELYNFLARLSTAYRYNSSKTNNYKTKFTFAEILMWQHYHCTSEKTIYYADTTFEAKQSSWLKNVMAFKNLFPDYEVECTSIKMQDSSFKPTLIFPSNREKFTKTNIDDYMKKHQKELRNFITNYKTRKNGNPMIATHIDLLRKNKGDKPKDSLMGCPAIYLGMGAGINRYEHHEMLINIGTYLAPLGYYQEEMKKKFPECYDDYDWENMEIEYIDDVQNRTSLPTDDVLRAIYLDFWQMQVYNLICRVRPFNKPTVIYWLGWNCPQRLIDESNVVYQ
jgi:hypothetical protein